MKLLFLCKRRPQDRDLLTRPYGRFYHLPRLLALRGHDVSVLLCSYKREPDLCDFRDDNGVHWHSVSLASLSPFRYYQTAGRLVEKIAPDWIVGFSDTYYGILAQHLARRYGCKSLIDAYDNYESYLPWLKPLHYLWRRALAGADLDSAAGPQLAEMKQQDRNGRPGIILPMAADPEFIPLDQYYSRRELGLSQESKLIGYCGALYRSRGIELLFQLADRLSLADQAIQIVVSGRKEKGLKIPPNICWLGYLPDQQMPLLLNSMDVLLVLNRESSFGQYSYPVKLYEAMRCRISVVASDTAPARWILGGGRRFLGNVGDLDDFFAKVMAALDQGKPVYQAQESWDNVAGELEKTLKRI